MQAFITYSIDYLGLHHRHHLPVSQSNTSRGMTVTSDNLRHHNFGGRNLFKTIQIQ
ncbi:hypothetical protein HanHA300_Chr16g0590791 [Helianthus annuus]|nr:hypothetical protein HanHA300_Chr16g0590791 [Helianthus annuus]KAJ0458715.1 hypothetical protein HanHA89_Chr16g0640951 [Helianthus annuus]